MSDQAVAHTAGPAVDVAAAADRITRIEIDQKSVVRWSPEIEHERQVAVFDLLENNSFALKNGPEGPYEVDLSLEEANLVFTVRAPEDCKRVVLSARPLRRVIKDYFMICDSYYGAIKGGAGPSKIEAIDMARRGLHDEGAELLKDALADKALIDTDTSRRLFTLVCVLHLRG